MAQRIDFIDLAKGLGISIIALTHTFGLSGGLILDSLCIFKIPLFFILSGLFFRTYDSNYVFLKKKTNQLLIPILLVYLCIGIPSSFLINWHSGTLSAKELFFIPGDMSKINLGVSAASWFLLSLYISNMYFLFTYKVCKGRISMMAICSLGLGFFGYFLNTKGVILPMWLDTSLTTMPFFCLGFILRHHSTILNSIVTKNHYGLLAMSLVLLVCIVYTAWGQDITYVANHYEVHIVLLYAGGIVGSLFIIILSKVINHLPVFSYIGRYSIVVLITHQIQLFFIRNLFYQSGLPQENVVLNCMVFVIITLLSIPIIKFGIKYLPYLFAQKDLIK